MRHCISLDDFSCDEIREIMRRASELKSKLKQGVREPVFEQLILGFVFEKPSLRTRVSFESLMKQHGGSSVYLGDEGGFGKREPLKDFIPILSSYVDLIVMRTKSHELVTQSVNLTQCPIINGLTDFNHPCQALADLMTVQELFGTLEDIKIAYVGDSNNVTRSLALLCSKLGVQCAIASPNGYEFNDEEVANWNRNSELVSKTNDPREAVDKAHAVYTDVWTSMGQEAEQAARLKAFESFQVNKQLMSLAAPTAKFLHCLPARRGEEVSAEVADGPASAIIQQAENRLHAQKGLVAFLLGK